jgi:hypothetical protein
MGVNRERLFDLLEGYYEYGGEALAEVIRRWQEDGDKLLDPRVIRHKKHTMHAHGLFAVRDLWPHREYTWTRRSSRLSAEEWDALTASIKAEGLKEPLRLMIGRKGGALIGEGNHRLAVAKAIGVKALPVQLVFYAGSVKKG